MGYNPGLLPRSAHAEIQEVLIPIFPQPVEPGEYGTGPGHPCLQFLNDLLQDVIDQSKIILQQVKVLARHKIPSSNPEVKVYMCIHPQQYVLK